MVGNIPRVFINELLSRTDIVALINIWLKLKKQGKNFYACCPFHNEKTPSFTVSIEKQFYYCFGCGSHGNAIDFLMNYHHFKFIESIEELAIMHGLEIPYTMACNHQSYYRRKRLYELMNKLSVFYHNILKETTILASVYNFFKKRGINEAIIDRFAIGYSPYRKNQTTIEEGFSFSKEEHELLHKNGIFFNKRKNFFYDRFCGRIMFPIRDLHGRVIAFGGRIVSDSKEEPKYLNTQETEIFCKGRQLYGLYEARQKNITLSRIIVVEGYIDVISLAQFGIYYVVALLGTTATTEQIELLYRFSDQIVYCYDGDHAGREAAWRTLRKTLPYLKDGRQLHFIFLPEGEDPDTIIRKIGKEKFEEHIKDAKSFPTLLFEELLKQVDLTRLDGRAKLSKLAFPLINQVPGETLRLYLRQKLGNKLGILDNTQLEKFLPQIENKRFPYFYHQIHMKPTILRTLVGLLVQNPKLSVLVPKNHGLEQANQLPGVTLFLQLLNICQNHINLTTGQLLEYYRGNDFYALIEKLAAWNHLIVNNMIEETFIDTLLKLYDLILEKRQEALIAYDRMYGLTLDKRKELWSLNKILAKT